MHLTPFAAKSMLAASWYGLNVTNEIYNRSRTCYKIRKQP
jgi:hypothetical protein